MPLRRLIAMLVPLVLAGLAGCGDDDSTSSEGDGGDLTEEEQAYVDEALEGFDAEEEAPMTEDDARCIATTMVQDVGVEDLEAAGLTPESFSSDDDLPEGLEVEQAQAIVDGMRSCIDLRDLFLQGMTEDESLSDDAQECLADQFDDDLVSRTMVVLLSEGEDGLDESSGVGAELMAAFTACPEALG